MARLIPILLLAFFAILPPHESAAAPAAPGLLDPADGARVGGYNPTLTWTLPEGVTQVHVRVTPFNNDGPGIDVVRGVSDSFIIPGLPECACLLPDMTYAWEVRVSDASMAVPLDDPSWSPPASRRFTTPLASSAGIVPVEPLPAATVNNPTPTLRWADSDFSVFYYEVQLSTDPAFGENAPVAPVYWNLIHGLVTSPPNSYKVPETAPLEIGKTYFWRVRPRIQGNGAPVAWSSAWSFDQRVQCCTVTAWMEQNSFAQEHQSHRAFGKLTDGAGKPLVGASMEAVWTQQGQRTQCFGGFSDGAGVASCIPPQAPVPSFIASVPVQVEVRFTHQGLVYSGFTSFTPIRSWNP